MADQPQPFRAGFVSIVGEPNAGKSSLMNAIVGDKVSIVTRKAQTTRMRIKGIVTSAASQVVFLDTPGIHAFADTQRLNAFMDAEIRRSFEESDVVLVVVSEVGSFARVASLLAGAIDSARPLPLVGVVTKIDALEPSVTDALVDELRDDPRIVAVLRVSAHSRAGLAELNSAIIARLPVHPPYFPDDYLTDTSERFVASEIVRHAVYITTHEEIPYSTAVVVGKFDDREDMLVIEADIIVERDSQKAIVIGKKGSMIKRIGMTAREGLEGFFDKKVYLSLNAKVVKDWTKDDGSLSRLGYRDGGG